MKILYLYSELGPYNIPVIKVLVDRYHAEIRIISWDKNKLKPYIPPKVEGVSYYSRSAMTPRQICEFANEFDPDLAYISGWMDKGYLKAARMLKVRNIPVVTGFDDIWVGNMRQKIGALVFRCYLNRYFSDAWVAGPRQFEFARRLGFANKNIIYDLLSFDHNIFRNKAFGTSKAEGEYPKSFLYIGNFRKVKGTDILVRAFRHYRDTLSGTWRLTCVGNGKLKNLLRNQPDITVHNYLEQEELVRICQASGCFVLPSRHDQWGVVVHECAAAGLPLLLSKNVGAKSTFLIEGYNGMSYSGNSAEELAKAMHVMSHKSDEELLSMSANSIELSNRITPETSAANFVSLVRNR